MAGGDGPGEFQVGEGGLALFRGVLRQGGLRLTHDPGQDLTPQSAMGLDDLEFRGIQPPGLEQDAFGDADLADVMELGGLANEADPGRGQVGGEARQRGQPGRQDLDITAGAGNVLARFRFPRLHQARQGAEDGILQHLAVPLPLIGAGPGLFLLSQRAPAPQFQVGAHPRLQDQGFEGLADEIRRPEGDGLFLVDTVLPGDQQQDRELTQFGVPL